ncbi:hypothetical protein BGW80DRAFT_1260952 [Lactifluus volemus]|nr:hypothetical protein BGW80DRAFT_1260952 [Lactifluus volemus]
MKKRRGKVRVWVQWLPQLLTMMALQVAQPNSYVKASRIRFPPMLTIYTAQILEMPEFGISVISIVPMILTHDRITAFDQRSDRRHPIELTLARCDCPQGAQSSSSRIPPRKRTTVLCYRDQWGENMADTIFAERGAACGVERGPRRLVGYVFFPPNWVKEPEPKLWF